MARRIFSDSMLIQRICLRTRSTYINIRPRFMEITNSVFPLSSVNWNRNSKHCLAALKSKRFLWFALKLQSFFSPFFSCHSTRVLKFIGRKRFIQNYWIKEHRLSKMEVRHLCPNFSKFFFNIYLYMCLCVPEITS